MFNEKFYVPILKWKKGEQEALKNLSESQKSAIIPLIEIVDYNEPEMIFECINSCFSTPVYIDTSIAAQDDRDYLALIAKIFKDNSKKIFPVLYYDDFPHFAKLINEVSEQIAIRVPLPEDIDGPSYSEIFEVIKNFKSNNDILIDIILDLNVIAKKHEANSQLRELKYVLEQFFINESFYNSIIISSTSFPENISSISAGETVSFDRYEVKLFKKILQDSKLSSLKEKLIYSDYGVTKFTDTELDFSKLKYPILPKVKYTIFDKYIVLKGARNHKTREMIKDYRALAKEILNSKYYFGENFSYGDLEIKNIAMKINNRGPGSHVTWVTIAANHHIAVVVEQLSKIL